MDMKGALRCRLR